MGSKGNVTGRTHPGRSYHSRPRDCRTVRVFRPGFGRDGGCPAMVRAALSPKTAEKPLAWQHDLPGLDASSSTNRPPFHVDLPGRRERSVASDGDDENRSGRRTATVSQETCHPCRAKSPTRGRRPDASTEVVMAEQLFSRVHATRSIDPTGCLFAASRRTA